MTEQTEVVTDSKPSNDTKGRLISMLVLTISLGISLNVLFALVLGQILFGLFAKEQNVALKELGKKLSDYMHDTVNYLTFNTEERPFPYKSWDKPTEQTSVVTDLPTQSS